MKRIIIQGSSNSTGNTYKIAQSLMTQMDFDFVDITQKDIKPFDYNFENADDDFLPLMRKIANEYDLIVFATPVYWYSMSGQMKIFFDRISDCLKTEKEIGRKLRNKSMAAICCGSGAEGVEGFFMPFQNTAKYLGMNYLGELHTWVEDDSIPAEVNKRIENFAEPLK